MNTYLRPIASCHAFCAADPPRVEAVYLRAWTLATVGWYAVRGAGQTSLADTVKRVIDERRATYKHELCVSFREVAFFE